MPNWKKIILSGSTANLNSLTVTNGITGSLFGTASYVLPTFISASAAASGFGISIANNIDNYIVTATGTSGSLNGESSLTFNGTTLGVGVTTPFASVKAHIKGILGVENGSTAGTLADQLLFGYNGSGLTQYNHKIQTSHDSQPVLNKMDFLVSNGASTFLNVLTLRSLGLSRFDSGQGLGVSGSLQVTGSSVISGSLNVSNGITGSLFGSASYATQALSASLVNGNVNVTTATIGNTVYATAGTTIGAGTTSIYSVSNASYSSIFADYSINEGTTNARAGTIQVISVGADINYTETTTMDIGNTDDITWDIYLSGADINFDIVNAAGASWKIKFSSRQM